MQEVAVVGLDLAKNIFQVHGIDAAGVVVVRKQLRRSQVLPFFEGLSPCLVGIEACASAHHWGRQLMAIGHEVRLMPPAYVKPYVKRGKTDAADAEAIAEAVTRPTMRFVAVKTEAQQAVLMLHKTRDLLVRQRTMLINALRGHLSEFGIVSAQGSAGVQAALRSLILEQERLPELAQAALRGLAGQLETLRARRSSAWNIGSSPGIGRMRPAGGSPLSQASGRSPPAPWRPVRPTPHSSALGASSLHGSGSPPGLTAAAARSGRLGSARWATAIYDGCSWSERRPCSAWPANAGLGGPGSEAYSIAKSRRSPPWRWPTRRRGSPGC